MSTWHVFPTQRVGAKDGTSRADRLLGCVIPPDYVEGDWVEEVS